MFEAVYIADSTNSLVFEYLINLSCPKFNSLKNLIKLDEYDQSKLRLVEINSEYFVAFEKMSNLVIYLLCSSKNDPNPVMPFVFINRLVEVMEDYFGSPLAVTKIDANIDTLTLLVNEMIDDGIPNVTDFNRLRDLIPLSNLFTKLLSTSNDLASAVSNKSLSSITHNTRKAESLSSNMQQTSVPWRRDNVKYTNNEMYVDVVETINVILKPLPKHIGKESNMLGSSKGFDSAFYSTSLKASSKLVPIVGTIDGQINFISHLTGVPYLQMILNKGGLKMDLPSFHECIELDKWTNDPGNLSFIPPDGNSTLMNYQIDLDTINKRDQKGMLGIVDIDYQHGLGTNQNEFEIRLFINSNKSVPKIENLCIEIHCDNVNEGETSSADDSSGNSSINVSNIRASRITHGDFSFKGSGKGEWNIRNISTGTQPMLHGSIVSDGSYDSLELASALKEHDKSHLGSDKESTPLAMEAIKPIHLKLSYSHKGCVPSGMKVDSLKIVSAKGLGDTVKPYKGVKYMAKTGNFIIRS
jgi:hypothetical protein